MKTKFFSVLTFAPVALATLISQPSFASSLPPAWEAPYAAVYKELDSNLHKPGKIPYFHARPAPKYDGVYLWDSSFISLIWNERNPEIAKDIVRAVIHNQQPDGRIPHVIDIFGISQWTQPPVLGWAASRIAQSTGDLDFVREVYPKLSRYHAWLLSDRRLPTGLFFWQHPYESGIDNSPRFGNRDESYYRDTRKVEAIDMSSHVAMDARALKKMALMLLDARSSKDDSNALNQDVLRLSAEIEEIGGLIRTRLWDEKTGYFYDRDENGSFVAIPTNASFFPLAAEVASDRQAARLVAHLQNPAEFNTFVPFPTVARNDKNFEKDCWRGPIWINTAYLIIQGMKSYGYKAEAKDMAYRLVDGVFKTWNNTHKFVEYYDPDRLDFEKLTRKRGTGLFQFFSGTKDAWAFLVHLFGKQLFLGTKPVDHFIGWTGLVNVLIHEENLTGTPVEIPGASKVLPPHDKADLAEDESEGPPPVPEPGSKPGVAGTLN
jgi:neutral trehalase